MKVPNGFAVTAEAYRLFLKWARLDAVIWLILKGVNTQDLANLQKRSK